MKSNSKNRTSLYVHIPFCDSKCFYCSFNSYTNLHSIQDRYILSLIEQFKFEIERFQIDKFQTVYIGGGTPSTLSIKNLEKISLLISPYLQDGGEWTIEVNPNSSSQKWLESAFQLGVNRISLGVQSFNDRKLKFLGRNHSSKIAIESVENVYRVGFRNINLDLIYNTALDTRELLNRDIDILFSLPLTHVSMYSLTLEEGTPFQNRDDVQNENLSLSRELIDRVNEKFPQYEISNFGNPSQHNLGYWQGENYIGLGSGAVGFLRDRRFYPNKNVERYIEQPLKFKEERLSPEDIKLEKLFLGFRSIVGVSKDILSTSEIERADMLVQEGILKFQDGKYLNLDYLLADEVALKVAD